MRVHGLFIRSDETQSSWLTLARFRILFLCTICLFAVTARLAAQLPERPLHLEELEQMALASNPTVAQATAKVRAARGRAIQAGLYTNPIVGFNSDEISGGPIIRGGEWGAFFQQTIVTAGKLGLSRKTAEQEVAQAEAAADAQRQRVLLLEAGGRPVGLEGFLDAGVRIPIFDRNQGNVEAARSELEHALKEVERIRLSLRARLAAAFKDYLDRKNMVDRYRDAILPRAQRAYDLYLSSYRQMAAAYPQVLIAQRTLFQLQEEYVAALAILWGRVVEIQGFLLLNGMQPPGL